jgi:putative NADH-flavin reductase
MIVLVVGASGETGRLLVRQLLDCGITVRIIVRRIDLLPEDLQDNDLLTIYQGSILEMSDAQLINCVTGVDAIASCLGHNLSMKGIFGKPRSLVTDAVRRLCTVVKSTGQKTKVKFVLMNTGGNGNKNIPEKLSVIENMIMFLIRTLLPPQKDNEDAADFLRTEIGNNSEIEWSVVRPDTLVNTDSVSEYEVFASPIRSPLFKPGETSRINVAHFMAELICNNETWDVWKGQMPVIYNKEIR